MNYSDAVLKNLIHIERGAINPVLCDNLVSQIENLDWTPHQWHNNVSDTVSSEITQELDIQFSSPDQQELLYPSILNSANKYNEKYSFNCIRTEFILNTISPPRFNRYSPGQIMRQHHDHIHSLFDGTVKGIPVLSFILNLNDDYEGAELFFWDDYIVPLGKGDIIMFPSLFLFPHGVKETTKGIRYSAVCWGW